MKYIKMFEEMKSWDIAKYFEELRDAMTAGKLDKVNSIIFEAPDVVFWQDNDNSAGWTALMWGVADHTDTKVDIIKVLINAGSNVNATDNFGCTALIHAATIDLDRSTDKHQALGQTKEILKLLLDSGANPYIKDFEPDEDEKYYVNYTGGEDWYDHATPDIKQWIEENCPEFWAKKRRELAQKRFDL